jgi:SnoaL-like domain
MIDVRALLRVYHDALNEFDFETVEQCFAVDALYHSPGTNGSLHGRANVMLAFRKYFAEYSDQVAVDDAVEVTGPLQVKTNWRLDATSNVTGLKISRVGVEEIVFDEKGLIVQVMVIDI